MGIDCCPKSPMDQDSGRIAFVQLENLLDLLLVCWERQEGGFSRTRDRRHEMGRHIVAQLQKGKMARVRKDKKTHSCKVDTQSIWPEKEGNASVSLLALLV